jgi:hypothetical protein
MSYVTRLTHLLNEDYSLPEGDPQMVDEFFLYLGMVEYAIDFPNVWLSGIKGVPIRHPHSKCKANSRLYYSKSEGYIYWSKCKLDGRIDGFLEVLEEFWG